MNPLKEALGERFFRALPRTPGVYFMLGAGERLLYVGKAKNLKARLRTYAQLKQGQADERILELIAHVQEIRWEDHASEARALARETELLRVLRPPYNVAGTDEELFLYIGTRPARTASGNRMDFRLSNWPGFESEGYEVFGAYRNRGKVKRSYTALLRLVHAYQCSSPRFSYPAKISRTAPPWQYRMRFPQELEAPLRDFLTGRSRKLLARLFEGLLENECLPAFMRPSIQDDIEAVKILFRKGPSLASALRRRHGLSTRPLSPQEMNELIEKEVRASVHVLEKTDTC
jgi:excinuclease ABC subunit C